ncbi:hypothetical protein N9N67_10625 [Bacteriovoracaceae bacterium]|nr:hypothetical protein [Bacteriovoracaceae bacterium]
MNKLLISMIIFLSFFSCSKKKNVKKKVLVQAQIRMAALAGYGGGGILIGTNGPESFTYFLDSNNLTIELPNGVWDFIVIAWAGGAGSFSGNNLCDVKQGISLEGDEVALPFNLASGKCNNPILGPSFSRNGAGHFNPLYFNSCSNWVQMIQDEGPIDLWSTQNIAYCDDSEGKEISFKIRMYQNPLSNNPWGTKSDPVESICQGDRTLGSGSLFSNQTIRWPIIDPNFAKIPFEVIAFDGANCTGGSTVYEFRNGSGAPAEGDLGLFMADASKIGAHLNSNLCEGAFLTNAPFANHTTTLVGGKEFLICTPVQLQAIADNWPALNVLSGVEFRIGKDLNLSSGFTGPIGNSTFPFNADFDGSGYTLSNWTYTGSDNHAGLFGVVGDAEIRDITIDNFNFSPSGSNQFVGTLFGVLEDSVSIRTEISNISIKNSTLTCDDCDRLAGLGGNVEIAVGNRDIEFRDIDLSGMYINGGVPGTASMDVGGVFGRFYSDNSIGLRANDISFHGKLDGGSHVGGFTALMQHSELENCEISAYDEVTPSEGPSVNYIQGHDFLGGIASEIWVGVKVSKCEAHVDIKVTGSDSQGASGVSSREKIGGAFGSVEDGGFNDLSITVDISTTDTDETIYVGGLVGVECNSALCNNVCNNYPNFINIDVDSTIQVNGLGVAGAFGYAECSEVKNILVESSIDVESQSDSDNYERGLYAGWQGSSSSVKMALLEGDVRGSKKLGGVTGHNQGNIEEVYVKDGSLVTCDNTDASLGSVGGVIGYNNTSVGVYVQNIISHTDVFFEDNVNSFDLGGEFIGDNIDNEAARYDNIYVFGFLKETGGSDVAISCGNSSSCSNFDGPDIWTSPQSYGGSFLIDEWADDGGGNATLAFYIAWKSFDDTVAGNYFDPFHLTDCHDWDKIQNNAVLMYKSYILDNDIFFDAAGCPAFVPIGGDENEVAPHKFLGNIISNKKWLRNITVNIGTDVSDPWGIIRILGDEYSSVYPEIGDWREPLVIKNVEFNAGSFEMSAGFGVAVGKVERGQVSAHVEYSDLTAGGTCGGSCTQGVGGVVGHMVQGSMDSSSYRYGTIDLSAGSYDNVGGLLGYIRSTSGSEARVSFYETMSDATIFAASNVGGLIGGISAGGSNPTDVFINDSYYFNDTANSLTASSGIKSGSFIGRMIQDSDSQGVSVDIDNCYSFANLSGDGTKAIEDAINVGGAVNLNVNLKSNFYYSTADTSTASQTFSEATIGGGNTFNRYNNKAELYNALDGNLDEERFTLNPNDQRAYLYYEVDGYYKDDDD